MNCWVSLQRLMDPLSGIFSPDWQPLPYILVIKVHVWHVVQPVPVDMTLTNYALLISLLYHNIGIYQILSPPCMYTVKKMLLLCSCDMCNDNKICLIDWYSYIMNPDSINNYIFIHQPVPYEYILFLTEVHAHTLLLIYCVL